MKHGTIPVGIVADRCFNCFSIGQRTEFGLDAGAPEVSEKEVQAAEVQIAAKNMTDRSGLVYFCPPMLRSSSKYCKAG